MFHEKDILKSSYDSMDAATGDAFELLGSWSCDLATEALTWSDGVFDMFGIERGRSIDRRDTLAFYSEASRELLIQRRQSAILAGKPFSCVAQLQGADGIDRWIQISAVPHLRDGRTVLLSGTKRDVTRERTAWDALRKLAHNDPLTGLSNRAAFQAGFLDLPKGSAELDGLRGLILFDLDRFKFLNDNWGHPAGDACLATFAKRLLTLFPDAQMIARIGGDEFGVLLDHAATFKARSGGLMAKMSALTAPFGWRDRMLDFGASAGVAFTDGLSPIDPDALFSHADADLYLAKARRTCPSERPQIAG